MNSYPVETLCAAMGGNLVSGDASKVIEDGVCTDTRAVVKGSLFFALVGENFDAHEFLNQAVEGGVAAIVVQRVPEGFQADGVGVIQVDDTLIALQRLAHWYRLRLEVVVVGITGSNGKTSTKDFTTAVLSQRFQVHATKGNFNNHIGLPLTVLGADDDDDVLVLEMGMNHPGEIAPLCEIARPHLGIITSIGTAHIEFMGSREAIAEEKGALARSLPEVGTLLVTASCDFAEYFRARTHARTIAVGNGRGVVRAEGLHLTEGGTEFDLTVDDVGSEPVLLPVVGRHMVNNALLAGAAGWALGLSLEDLASGLEAAKISGGRLHCFESDGIVVFDDTYNANPDSMKAAIDVVADQVMKNGNKRTVVLGMMGELGTFAEEMHREVGEYAARQQVRVVSVGELARGIAEGARSVSGSEIHHFDEYDEAATWLRETLHAGDVVLFKGSRAAAVERVMKGVFPEN